MAGYLFPLTPLQRSRLRTLLAEVKGEDVVIDAIAGLLDQAARVADAEAARLVAMDKDLTVLDWAWVEALRQEWSQAADGDWTTGEVLAVVMAAPHKQLWQPRTI